MAKRGRRKKSLTGYFKKIFIENPQWIEERSNDPVLARYRIDHKMAPDAPIRDRVKSAMANTKSMLRSEGRGPGSAAGKAAPKGGRPLEALEEMIDDCLTTAKQLDRQGLDSIITLLRRARNHVVWKLGEK